MAYRAYLNNSIFFSTDSAEPTLKLSSAELSLVSGQAGSFSFTVPPDNVAFDSFVKFKSYVDVYKDTELVFSGRVLEDGKNFTTEQPIMCEGMMAVLNDSIFRPVTINDTLQNLVETIIENHNSQVEAEKQITIGTITVEDEYVYRAYETIETSWSRLSDLVESYGGMMQVVKTEGVLYLNWWADLPQTNTQTIDFGSNILDITQQSSGADIMTVLVPQGAEVENEDGTQSRVGISSVNGGLDYLIYADGVTEFGLIVGTQIWDDVTQPAILKSKAQNWLQDIARNRVSINLSVVDLSAVDASIEHFTIGQKVIVTSAPHGISSQTFTVQERHLNLLDPTQNQMSLGQEVVGYVGKTSRQLSENVQRIDHITADYVTNDRINSINELMQSYETQILQTSEMVASIASQITTLNDQVTANQTRIEQTANQLSVFVDANGETLTYFILDAQGLWIGNPADPVRLLETNNSIKFVDSTGNTVLLEINTGGIVTPTVSATNQIAMLNGSTGEWAIRKGDLINGRHNLDFVYIGD